MEALLEQASINLSSVVSDLFGASGLRILAALSQGNTDPDALANLADHRLRASRETLTKQLGELNEAAAQRMQPPCRHGGTG